MCVATYHGTRNSETTTKDKLTLENSRQFLISSESRNTFANTSVNVAIEKEVWEIDSLFGTITCAILHCDTSQAAGLFASDDSATARIWPGHRPKDASTVRSGDHSRSFRPSPR